MSIFWDTENQNTKKTFRISYTDDKFKCLFCSENRVLTQFSKIVEC